MSRLRLSSCMAPNMDGMVSAIANWLTQRLEMPVDFVKEPGWRQRETMFDDGAIDMVWICGLPYIWRADDKDRAVRLLAAPVMAAERYQDKPVYFSDVVVRHDAPYQSFSDLAQTNWAVNEPHSHSGYNITRYHLAKSGLDWSFFRSVKVAGSHQACIAALLAGEIDAAAIDSTVLEQAVRASPGLLSQLRSIETLGPSPIPPWLAGDHLEAALAERIKESLLSMSQDVEGKAVLTMGGVARMAAMVDEDYDLIRRMERVANRVSEVDELGN